MIESRTLGVLSPAGIMSRTETFGLVRGGGLPSIFSASCGQGVDGVQGITEISHFQSSEKAIPNSPTPHLGAIVFFSPQSSSLLTITYTYRLTFLANP